MTKVRKGQATAQLSRVEFRSRFEQSFYDPAFTNESDALSRIEAVAWDAYSDSRKSPVTRKAGKGYADPDYDLSVEWLKTRARLKRAEVTQRNSKTTSRVLLIVGAARNDGSCPGEMSKTFRLAGFAREVLDKEGIDTDLLDLSLLTSEYGRRIYPCKGCVSTAMPLCHWPCTCYPNHSLTAPGNGPPPASTRPRASSGTAAGTAYK